MEHFSSSQIWSDIAPEVLWDISAFVSVLPSHPLILQYWKESAEVHCSRNRWDPSLPQILSVAALQERFSCCTLVYFNRCQRKCFSLSTQVTRHDNTCCSTCPLGILHRKGTTDFTEVFQETFLLCNVLFQDSNRRWRAISQHKPLCKHVTKIGHVLHVCFTNSLHFLLQVLPGASIKTAGS